MESATFGLPTVCWNCGKGLDTHTSLTGFEPPVPGSYSICGHCGYLAVYDTHLQLVPPTQDDMIAFAADPSRRRLLQETRKHMRTIGQA